MPSVSAKQHRFFGAMKSHPAEARARGISPAVAQEFLHADKGMHFQHGGVVPDSARRVAQHPPAFMRKGGWW